MNDAFAEPMTMTVVDGAVVILGPDGIAAALTPDAAEDSGRRLLEAAAEARRAAASLPMGEK